MKTKLLFGLLLFLGLSAFAYVSYPPTSSFTYSSLESQQLPPASAEQLGFRECNAKIQGGADGFPWSVAKPFPWSDIQGVWKLRDGLIPYYLKAKVIRTTSDRKILNLSVISQGNCTRPLAQGLGYIDFSDRNVIRAIINDGMTKYQMKIAAFDVRDLEIDSYACGENVVVASIQAIGSFRNTRPTFRGFSDADGTIEKVMLKKNSDDIASICRKLDNK